MKVFTQTLAVLFGMALLRALGVGGYVAAKWIVSQVGRMSFPIAGDTPVALIAALLAAVIIARSICYASRQSKLNLLHLEKVATYKLFVDLRADFFGQGRGSVDSHAAEFSEAMQTLNRLLALYGSPAALAAANLRATSRR